MPEKARYGTRLVAFAVMVTLGIIGSRASATALAAEKAPPWSGLKFSRAAFNEVVELARGQHLLAHIPRSAWRAAADGALRALPTKARLFPATLLPRLPSMIASGLVKKADAKSFATLRCEGRRTAHLVVMTSSTERRIPKMSSLSDIRAYRARRRRLREELTNAWKKIPFGRREFACTMQWVQTKLPEQVATAAGRCSQVTRLQQRQWDAWRIAASHFLQALDPHCHIYPNSFFEAQEKAVSTEKPVTAALLRPYRRRIGMVRVHQFATETAIQAEAAVAQLQRRTKGGLRALVIDMRGNSGGWVKEATAFADLFLGDAVITKEHHRQKIETKRARTQRTDLRCPLVVLIDARCMSSCELVAAALHENNRAIVVGARSYGKATVQGVFEAQQGPWSVFLTIARYHGPRGESIQRWGVTPDVEIASMTRADAKAWRESRYAHALAPRRKHAPHKSRLLTSKRFARCYKKIHGATPTDKRHVTKDLGLRVARDHAHALAGGCSK